MASLATKVKLYCEANSKTVDFTKDVLLQNDSDGKGDYIKEWNVSGLDKPTDEQLDRLGISDSDAKNIEFFKGKKTQQNQRFWPLQEFLPLPPEQHNRPRRPWLDDWPSIDLALNTSFQTLFHGYGKY